ncbi:hypothetical protein ACWT_5391 [Actinoplanes sp. SE50]|nr:hypothetical protein ACPL_5522 [Actinoplanes sp. SE50/110]ATO84806.1 hypothetical protein ACWT_5391 [Actinoplanes sp. SE50]SLM02216.1 hypothetical protein ACSP50_5454 [Actinoplanes sp. SE50/110]
MHPLRRITTELGAGFRFLSGSPPLRRVTLASVLAAFAVGGGGDATGYAVISQGLHRAPQFTGPQTAGLALGAVLIAVLDYRLVLVGAGLCLLVAAAALRRTKVPEEPSETAAAAEITTSR